MDRQPRTQAIYNERDGPEQSKIFSDDDLMLINQATHTKDPSRASGVVLALSVP
jgi:hypothetical protein